LLFKKKRWFPSLLNIAGRVSNNNRFCLVGRHQRPMVAK
jgi:hypothetical protein